MSVTEEFFAELDRRIESPDSTHHEASKQRLHILHANDPAKFDDVVLKVLPRYLDLA
jgi:hypothetical protein